MSIVHVVPLDKEVTGCQDCYESGIVHLMKNQKTEYGFCSCALGQSLQYVGHTVTRMRTNKMRRRQKMESLGWRLFKIEEFIK